MSFTTILSRQRALLAVLAAGILLLFAACGASPDAELSTINGNFESTNNDEAVPDTGDDEARELSTIDASEDGDQLPVPDAEVPPAPAPETSPAERQRLQELGVPESVFEPIERLGTPDEDLDDASNPANAVAPVEPAAPRADLDQFPATIPAIIPGAPDSLNYNTNNSGLYDPNVTSGGNPEFPGFNADIETEIPVVDDGSVGGVQAPDVDVVEPVTTDDPSADDAATNIPDCAPETQCDGSPEAVELADEPTTTTSGASEPAPVRESDCVNRPWDRGCPGPVPDPEDVQPQFTSANGDAEGGDAGSDSDGTTNADGDAENSNTQDDESQGVVVPQEVIDILLSPSDAELADDADADDRTSDDSDG